ncbi:MAG: RsmE family RNA methyltransferase, partial [Acidobacteria bacterium]|nr:RsmE family RNA methyltransferase [Acidobacteriota bacterium]
AEISALEEALLHCSELGLWKFCPVLTKHSAIKFELIEKKLERLQKIAISAIKQSGFPFLPEIAVFDDLNKALNSLPNQGFLFSQEAKKWFLDFKDFKSEITLAVGPEGDFSEEEKNLFEKFGYQKAKLSENTLRVETAAITALAQMQRYL